MSQRNILSPSASVLVKSRGVGRVPPLHANPSAVTCAKSKASRLFGVDIITELRGWSSDSGLRFQFIAVPANTSLHHIFPKFSNLLAYFRCKIQVFWEGHKTFVKLLLFYFTLLCSVKWKMGQIFVTFSEYVSEHLSCLDSKSCWIVEVKNK